MQQRSKRETLILEHYFLVQQIARKMSAKLPPYIDVDDLISIGTIGLIDAADRYNPDLCVAFGSYARIRIKGTIVDRLRAYDWVPRVIRANQKVFGSVQSELRSTYNREPTRAETSSFLRGLGIRDPERFQQEAHVTTIVSIESTRPDSEQRLGDQIVCQADKPDQLVSALKVRERIADELNRLPERDRTIIQLYYFEGQSHRAIGDALGVSESRVCQIHRRIREKIRHAICDFYLELAA